MAGRLFLPKIDVEVLTNFYDSGGTSTLVIPSDPAYMRTGANTISGYNLDEDIFSVRDDRDNRHIFHTTDNIVFQDYQEHGQIVSRQFRCKMCNFFTRGIPLGIPISRSDGNEKVIYNMTDVQFCSFECSLLFINTHYSRLFLQQSSLYKESKTLLFVLFAEIYGTDAELIESIEPDLFVDNGGTITRESYDSQIHKFTRCTSTIVPVKKVYTVEK
jgi:hypothetical protein